MWTCVLVRGDDAAGLEVVFGRSDGVFDQDDFGGAALEDVEAAGFVPLVRGLAEFVVLEEFDGEVAEGLVAIVDDVGEVAGDQGGLAIRQFGGDGGLAFDLVDDFGCAQHDVDVVVTVRVEKRVGMGGDVDEEDADLRVLEDQAVVGLGGDFDFWGGLRREESGREQEQEAALHGGDCSIGGGAEEIDGCATQARSRFLTSFGMTKNWSE